MASEFVGVQSLAFHIQILLHRLGGHVGYLHRYAFIEEKFCIVVHYHSLS